VGAREQLGAMLPSIKHTKTCGAGKEGLIKILIIDGDSLDQRAANRVSEFSPVMVEEILHGAHLDGVV